MIHRRLITKGIKYYLTLPHNTGHGIHSPSLFRLINEVFSKDIDNVVLRKIENYRQNFINNHNKILVTDFGARGTKGNTTRRISDIAVKESIHSHYGNLLYNLVHEFKPQTVVELGTSLGIGTLYMALAHSGSKIFTIEGASEKASLASSMLHKVAPNVEVFSGNFSEKLPEVLKLAGKVDFVFIDGNHKKDSTLKYFEEIMVYTHSNSVIVLDDINWSPGMMQAWKEIQKHEKSRVCLDLFRIGIVLLNPKLQKENFTVFY